MPLLIFLVVLWMTTPAGMAADEGQVQTAREEAWTRVRQNREAPRAPVVAQKVTRLEPGKKFRPPLKDESSTAPAEGPTTAD